MLQMQMLSLPFNLLINKKKEVSTLKRVKLLLKCHFLSLSQCLTFSEYEALPWNGARITELSKTLKSHRKLL